MSYEEKLGTTFWVSVKLVADDDFKTQRTGKTHADATVRYRKSESAGWSVLTTTDQNWREIGNGFYEVKLEGTQTDTAGRLDYQVECAGCLDYNGAVMVVRHDPRERENRRACANVGFDGTTLSVNAWLERDGRVATDATACAVKVCDDAGAEMFELAAEMPDAQGVFRMTKTEPGLEPGRSYYARVEIERADGTDATIEGVATL